MKRKKLTILCTELCRTRIKNSTEISADSFHKEVSWSTQKHMQYFIYKMRKMLSAWTSYVHYQCLLQKDFFIYSLAGEAHYVRYSMFLFDK